MKIQRGIFQGDALSPLLFVIGMMPLNHILRKCRDEYTLHKSQEKIYHQMFMDDIKLFAKNEKELETLMQAVRIYSEFGIMLIMRSGKRQMTKGININYQLKEKSEHSEKRKLTNTWKYWMRTVSNKRR